MKCKACGNWFSSTDSKAKLCIDCERAMARLYGYAAPIVRGRWKRIVTPYGELEGFIHAECGWSSKCASKYCPECGAKMDEEETS